MGRGELAAVAVLLEAVLDLREELGPALEAARVHALREAHVVHGTGWVADLELREARAEDPAARAVAADRDVLREVEVLLALLLGDDRAEAGELDGALRAVARLHEVGRPVVAPFLGADRAEDRDLAAHLGERREVLRDEHARRGLDLLVGAVHFAARLGVEGVYVARAAREVEHDDGLALAAARGRLADPGLDVRVLLALLLLVVGRVAVLRVVGEDPPPGQEGRGRGGAEGEAHEVAARDRETVPRRHEVFEHWLVLPELAGLRPAFPGV